MNLEAVDRGVQQALAKETIRRGYIPNIDNYTTAEEYAAAKVTLKEQLEEGTIIEVFGVGSSQSRREKTDSKITVDRKGFKETGTFIYAGERHYINDDQQTFKKVKNPDAVFDIEYEVRIITTKTSLDRVMTDIVLDSLGTKQYIPFYVDGQESEHRFYVQFSGQVDISKDDFIERIFKYVASEVTLVKPKVIKPDVPMLKEVTVTMVPVPIDTNLEDETLLDELAEGENKVTFEVGE